MLTAVLIICISVLLGTLLALIPKNRGQWMGPVRTFALTAALSVVVLHLLPEALSSIGAWALLVFLVGLIAPEVLGKSGELLWRAGHEQAISADRRKNLALEASYFGLLFHRVGDGLGLGAFTGEMHATAGSGGVLAATAAHAVPVVAIVVLTFDSVRGRGSALARAFGLAAASLVGVVFAHSLPQDSFAAATGYVSAFVGGTLLHVVTHDLAEDLPQTPTQRGVDLLSAALGICVTLLGRETHVHGDAHEHAAGHFETALVDFAVETGPLLVLGLVVGALLTAWGPKLSEAFFKPRGVVIDAARGTLVGAPLPLCSCSVLPISSALVARGAAPAMVVSFLLATPELGVETFALSVRFLGWEMAWVRLVGALLVAFATAVVVGRVTLSRKEAIESGLPPVAPRGPFAPRVLAAFDELLHHIGSWMILGLVAAALLEVTLPVEALAGLDTWLEQFLVVTAVAVPSYVCAPSATPLAAVLLGKGLSPGAVLLGLLLGPATNIATVVFLKKWFGRRGAMIGVFFVIAFSWMLGLFVDFGLGLQATPLLGGEHRHEHSALWMAAAWLSFALVLRALYKAGVRGFLSTLVGEHGHSHGDDSEHGHAHGGHGHAEHGHAHGGHGHAEQGHAHGGHGHAEHGHAHGGHGHAEHGHAHGGHGHAEHGHAHICHAHHDAEHPHGAASAPGEGTENALEEAQVTSSGIEARHQTKQD